MTLLAKQNEESGTGIYEDQLRFNTVRELLKDITTPGESQKILAKIDSDCDARVSYDEFQAAMSASHGEQDDASFRAAFRRLDANGDEFLTKQEILASIECNKDSLHRMKKT